jgi:ATP-binding cassette subfamily B protein
VLLGLIIDDAILPRKLIGKKPQRLARQQMQLTAEVGALMNERFNVAGAMLSKFYGRPEQEADLFTRQAGRVRHISIVSSVYARGFFIVVTTLAPLITTLVYGLGPTASEVSLPSLESIALPVPEQGRTRGRCGT